MAVHVGKPRTIASERGRPWTSAIFKGAVSDPVIVDTNGLQGDEQADLRVHGGPDKAVCAYPAAHYPFWRAHIDPSIGPGGFGENLTLHGLDETTVCIGDRWRLGSVVLEASQPRSPCYKIARRWGVKDLAVQFQHSGRTGWYWRVHAPGTVQAGDPVELMYRPNHDLTVAAVNLARWHPSQAPELPIRIVDTPQLSESWRNHFAKSPISGGRADTFRLSGP